MQLRMTINAILDQLVHCEGMTEGEAMALMTQRGFQEEGEAAGKWRRALLTSTQLSTYFVGYSEVAAIAAARPAGVSLLTWHDAMLAHGSPRPATSARCSPSESRILTRPVHTAGGTDDCRMSSICRDTEEGGSSCVAELALLPYGQHLVMPPPRNNGARKCG
jgi:hypothetical protein